MGRHCRIGIVSLAPGSRRLQAHRAALETAALHRGYDLAAVRPLLVHLGGRGGTGLLLAPTAAVQLAEAVLLRRRMALRNPSATLSDAAAALPGFNPASTVVACDEAAVLL